MDTNWTPEEDAFIAREVSAGRKVPEIAAELGRGVPTTYNRVGKLGIVIQAKDPIRDESTRDELRELFARGFSTRQIASMTGRGEHSVRWYLEEMGLKRGRQTAWTVDELRVLKDLVDAGTEFEDIVRAFPSRVRDVIDSAVDKVLKDAEREAARKAASEGAVRAVVAKPVRPSGVLERAGERLVEVVRGCFERRTKAEGAIVDHVIVKETAKAVAEREGVSAEMVRSVAEALGFSFKTLWTAEQDAALLEAAARFGKNSDVASHLASGIGRKESEIEARMRDKRIRAHGRTVVRRPAAPVRKVGGASGTVATVVPPVRAVEAARPVQAPPRRRAAAPVPGKAEMADLVAAFMRVREVKRIDDGETLTVRSLQSRGYVVLRKNDDMFTIDGRHEVRGLAGLREFADLRGISTGKEARAT